MTEQEVSTKKRNSYPRKGCPLRRGEDRCLLNGASYCFPEGVLREELEHLITLCGQATTRGETQRLPLRRRPNR